MSGTARLQPPANDPPVAKDGGQHSPAWTNFFQKITDQLQALQTLQASAGKGVTDGSEAAAGDVGEYMAVTGGTGALVSATTANLASLDLTAGDWDVSGTALFSAGSGSHIQFAAGIASLDAVIQATFPTTALTQALPTALHRYNVTFPTTVWLVANAVFTGAVNASGTIRARRAR